MSGDHDPTYPQRVRQLRGWFYECFRVKPPGEVDMRTNLTEKERVDLWHAFLTEMIRRPSKKSPPAQ